MPGSSLPLETYGDLVADAKANGCRTLVDLSSPRMDSALRGEPDVAKLNDWELAEMVRGPVSEPAQLLAAAGRLRDMGARTVIVTRGEHPALVLGEDGPAWLTPPRFEHGYREGCGDTMMGAMTAAWALGESFERALAVGAAAGAANFLRHGLGSASREVVERLVDSVTLEPWEQPALSRWVERCDVDHPTEPARAPGGHSPRWANPSPRVATHQGGLTGSPATIALGAVSAIQWTCSAEHTSPMRAKLSDSRNGRPASAECESLASRCTSPSLA